MLGILVVDKPQGITSHDVVAQVRRKFNTKRVGHAGTLDPLATGVLVVAVGPATRFLQYLALEPKEYVFEAKFGAETNTQDSEGEVLAEKDVPANLEQLLQGALENYRGEIWQLPPMFSAVKKAGKPLYFYARQGEEIEREKRQVFIESFELVSVEGNHCKMRAACSGGTYVRTLAHDLGQDLGCGAHLTSIRRTQVGRFTLDHAVLLDDATANDLVPLGEALKPLESVAVPPDVESRLREGQRVPVRPVPVGPFVTMADSQGGVIGVARVTHGSLHPECVIPKEAMVDPL